MAFAPPTTFVDGTVLTAAALEGNEEALRVYLHRGIIAGDLTPDFWRKVAGIALGAAFLALLKYFNIKLPAPPKP